MMFWWKCKVFCSQNTTLTLKSPIFEPLRRGHTTKSAFHWNMYKFGKLQLLKNAIAAILRAYDTYDCFDNIINFILNRLFSWLTRLDFSLGPLEERPHYFQSIFPILHHIDHGYHSATCKSIIIIFYHIHNFSFILYPIHQNKLH